MDRVFLSDFLFNIASAFSYYEVRLLYRQLPWDKIQMDIMHTKY